MDQGAYVEIRAVINRIACLTLLYAYPQGSGIQHNLPTQHNEHVQPQGIRSILVPA